MEASIKRASQRQKAKGKKAKASDHHKNVLAIPALGSIIASDLNAMASESPKTKPVGWLVGFGVLCITLGVVLGLIAIGVVAKRQQRYRINEGSVPTAAQPSTPATNTVP